MSRASASINVEVWIAVNKPLGFDEGADKPHPLRRKIDRLLGKVMLPRSDRMSSTECHGRDVRSIGDFRFLANLLLRYTGHSNFSTFRQICARNSQGFRHFAEVGATPPCGFHGVHPLLSCRIKVSDANKISINF